MSSSSMVTTSSCLVPSSHGLSLYGLQEAEAAGGAAAARGRSPLRTLFPLPPSLGPGQFNAFTLCELIDEALEILEADSMFY
jgi:hypothetical protein